jgi:hypothetical protein
MPDSDSQWPQRIIEEPDGAKQITYSDLQTEERLEGRTYLMHAPWQTWAHVSGMYKPLSNLCHAWDY